MYLEDNKIEIKPIAIVRSPFMEKFGIPRQSNIVEGITSCIVFEPQYRSVDAVRGLEGFDYVWLIWLFSENLRQGWSPTVRPPRLGGNRRVGVFASRSPFRPNGLGLSSVRIVSIDADASDGPLIYVAGADLLDGTPVFDIKPYIPYTDSHPDARSGFAPCPAERLLNVRYEPSQLRLLPPDARQPLLDILAHDPRPSYHNDPSRVYGFLFLDFNVTFSVPVPDTIQLVAISKK